MGRKNLNNPLTGNLHPQVVAMAGLDRFDTPRNRHRIWIDYQRSYHPAPVIMAERFKYWEALTDVEKINHLTECEIAGAAYVASKIGKRLGGGIHKLREKFATASEWAAVCGDREFHRTVVEVLEIIDKSAPGKSFRQIVFSAWHFLMLVPKYTEKNSGNERVIIQRKGTFPTAREILSLIEKSNTKMKKDWWPGDEMKTIRDVCRKSGLKLAV